MRAKNKIGGYIIRSAASAVFLLEAVITFSWAFDLPDRSQSATGGHDTKAKTISQPRALTFAERVAFRRVIEDVYWRHRIWPKENPDPKPSLDAVMSHTQLENKVAGYLRDSLVLEDYWHRPISAEQLQAEIDRMARDTKQPEVLHELFEALGNDPAVIAECLARPTLAERLISDLSAQDKTRHIESPRTHALPTTSAVASSGQFAYTLPKIADAADSPCSDMWATTSTSGAPSGRSNHTVVWTGSEMIVWGGDNGPRTAVSTGGRYNPATDSWTHTETSSAPQPRSAHTAIWTGTEMIIWGGFDVNYPPNALGSGGRYNPVTNSWTETSGGPSARGQHTAVWTGTEMIVWGGCYLDFRYQPVVLNDGGTYNPVTDGWTATSGTNVPLARRSHTAVWTGSEMIVWGGVGESGFLNTGGRYNPGTNSWIATSTANAPSERILHTAVWTGNEMIVWGGGLNTGGRYNPGANSWIATNTTNAPSSRAGHTAVWTGTEMIVWGGYHEEFPLIVYLNDGNRYNPDTNSWAVTNTTNVPSARAFHTAVWTDGEMIIWGGHDGTNVFNTGGRYCGQYPTPTPTSTPTPTASPTPTPTPTPCTGRCSPTPRLRPAASPRPTPRPHITPVPPPPSPRPTPPPRPLTLATMMTPTMTPMMRPSMTPRMTPTMTPMMTPTMTPMMRPSMTPRMRPSMTPMMSPTMTPMMSPTMTPMMSPTMTPMMTPTMTPMMSPTMTPMMSPTMTPMMSPTMTPMMTPTMTPRMTPTMTP